MRSVTALDSNSRLDLYGHGNKDSFNWKTSHELASILHKAGLRKVGVIKFQSCNIRKGNYLREFIHALDSLGIQVGYVSGAKDKLAEWRLLYEVNGKISIHIYT